MSTLGRPCIAVLLSLAAGCAASPANQTPPPTTDHGQDAAGSTVPVPVRDAASVTPAPPQSQPDASPASDQAAVTPPPAGARTLVVEAGELDRENTIVGFTPPGAARWFVLVDGQGARLQVQVHESGQAVFVLPSLKAGAQATFTLEEASGPPPAGVAAVREADGVKLAIGGADVFRYQTTGKLPGGVGQSYLRGGYIHPLYTPGGLLVTDDYPGDHRHHHGIWSAWAHTTFEGRHMDFWNMGGGSAKVDFESLATSWDGPVHAGFRAHHLFTDLRGAKAALKEEWTVTVYKTSPTFFVFDLDSVQEAATAAPVDLDQYLYGGFAFRGSAQWRGGATFLTSEGKDRGSGDGTSARWCYIGGSVGGKLGGYAVLGHPSNFRAPQPMRINPTDPYFSFSPVKPSGFPIVPGKPYASRFRFVVTDGAPDKALFERQWNDYATPPKVTLR
jgi:hypothetical protein